MHSAMDHDCTLNDRFGKPSCMTEFEQEIRQDERQWSVEVIVETIRALPWTADNFFAFDERAAIIAAIKGEQA